MDTGYNNTQKQFDFNNLFILEMANNHQGSVAHGKKIIASLAPIVKSAGVRAAIKFQFRNLGTFIHPHFRRSRAYKHIPRFLSTALSREDFKKLVRAAEEAELLTMATPFDEASVAAIEDLDLDLIKVASCSAQDWPLLERIAESGKPVVCSTGGLSLAQVDNLVSFFEHRGVHFALMHCVSIYPTPPHKLALERIRVFRERYPHVTIGYSTHEEPENMAAVQLAYASGARIFERHVGVPTDEIKLNAYSSRPDQIARWLESHRAAVSMIGARGAATERDDEEEAAQLALQMRGIYARRRLRKGAAIARGDVFFAMPLQEGQLASGEWRPNLIADRAYRAHEALPAQLLPATPTRKQIIYRAVHDVKGMLNSARVAVGDESSVTLEHPNGIDSFFTSGLCAIDCAAAPTFRKRILMLLPGQSYPEHYERHREKTLQVLSGACALSVGGKRRILHPGDVLTIPQGTWHAYGESEGAILEALISPADEADPYFMDKRINRRAPGDRATKLIRWGRHQFDTAGHPTYHD